MMRVAWMVICDGCGESINFPYVYGPGTVKDMAERMGWKVGDPETEQDAKAECVRCYRETQRWAGFGV